MDQEKKEVDPKNMQKVLLHWTLAFVASQRDLFWWKRSENLSHKDDCLYYHQGKQKEESYGSD